MEQQALVVTGVRARGLHCLSLGVGGHRQWWSLKLSLGRQVLSFSPVPHTVQRAGENGAPEVAAPQAAQPSAGVVLGWSWVLRDTHQLGGWSWGREAELEPWATGRNEPGEMSRAGLAAAS